MSRYIPGTPDTRVRKEMTKHRYIREGHRWDVGWRIGAWLVFMLVFGIVWSLITTVVFPGKADAYCYRDCTQPQVVETVHHRWRAGDTGRSNLGYLKGDHFLYKMKQAYIRYAQHHPAGPAYNSWAWKLKWGTACSTCPQRVATDGVVSTWDYWPEPIHWLDEFIKDKTGCALAGTGLASQTWCRQSADVINEMRLVAGAAGVKLVAKCGTEEIMGIASAEATHLSIAEYLTRVGYAVSRKASGGIGFAVGLTTCVVNKYFDKWYDHFVPQNAV